MKYIKQINTYIPSDDQEENDKKIILDYINVFGDNVLTRENEVAHITSSGFILNKALNKTLMIHHNIYKTWAWTGGHADGDSDLLEIAIKEANEETGLKNIIPLNNEISTIDIIPVWGHIKNGKYVSTHLHLNISYILIGDENENLIVNEAETSGIKWINIDEIETHSNEPQLKEIYFKLIEKAKKSIGDLK
ncbi:NUDIX hydrolase [Clostridiaceae bacterium HSG29]|nr:NUDIX hydrolase [Clostridiaceae bacterium HSG29]